jgi:hypothetical protein
MSTTAALSELGPRPLPLDHPNGFLSQKRCNLEQISRNKKPQMRDFLHSLTKSGSFFLSRPSHSMAKIAILGWGSLLWDESDEGFNALHGQWRSDGPILKLEFSRKSMSRLNALTLIIDPVHGHDVRLRIPWASGNC